MTVRIFVASAVVLLLHAKSQEAFTLITFDVDGTLVHGSGQAAEASAHSRAFSHAVGSVFPRGPVQAVAEALPRELYHGSTDGLILLRLARATLGIEPDESFPKLDRMMERMYDFIAALTDEEVAQGITPLPGVIDTLKHLATLQENVMCGLVTGNVEGIARRKMRAVGILQTGALAQPTTDQRQWVGSEDIGFLGGFGSDYCSGDIDDVARNYLDRSRQIEIAAHRCRSLLPAGRVLKRVVHVGDAPADVLAAKAYATAANRNGDSLCVGMVATATGSYSADQLRELGGASIPGRWEYVVLEDGIADPKFVAACGL